MKYILLKGVHFENKGAELMMRTLISKLEIIKDIKIVLTVGWASKYLERSKLGCYQYFNIGKGRFDFNRISYWLPKKLRNWLSDSYGIVFESDLHCILDSSGFAYGDKWPMLNIVKTCSQIERIKKNNKKYMFLPQAFGPFSKAKSRKKIAKYFCKSDQIFARDKISYEYLKELIGDCKNLSIAPDFTNLLQYEEICHSKNILKAIIIPNFNMISERNMNSNWSNNYINMFIDIIFNLIKEKYHVVILNHEGKADLELCNIIYKPFLNYDNVELSDGLDALQIKKTIGSSNLVISSRYHGCVSSLAQGVPCIGTTWSHKYEELYNDYGVNDLLLLSPLNTENVEIYLKKIINNLDQYRNLINKNGNKLVEKSLSMFNFVVNHL